MNTPICDFVKEYAKKNAARFHMPGHKGIGAIGPEALDITEISGADVLYSANGIIKRSEQNAAKIFNTKATFYSTEGSSLCIRAMLYMLKKYALKNGKNPLILAGRNAHKTFVTATAILDVEFDWLYGGDNILSCKIDINELENRIKEKQPVAVYITSPDYLGNTQDIENIAEICKKNCVLLLCDNAHGAYFNFLEKNIHPMYLGADICCDSAHKTLPALTGSAYLHISKNTDDFFAFEAENAMSLFASTSPSYLILQSLDALNLYLENAFSKDLQDTVKAVEKLKEKLTEFGFSILSDEPLKLTIKAKKYGYKGYEIAEYLEKNNVFSEFSDPDFLTLMFSPNNTNAQTEKLLKLLSELPKKAEINQKPPVIKRSERVFLQSEALLKNSEKVPVEKALGEVLATPTVSCPPAIPIVLCGEKIDAQAIECFKYYGIDFCHVIKE